MWKQRVDAGLRLRRVEDEFGLAIFLPHRIKACDCDLPEGLAVRRHAVAEQDVINGVCKRRHAQCGGEPDDCQSLQESLDFVSQR